MALKTISVRGAREHNLKNINVDIPRDTLTVITGLSGSGKSSLAFDTIYAEGQRRYVESLSAYARQFLQLMQKPDMDSIEGLSPAISIEQKTTSKNPRSTVGTVTEIYDYMRLLWARVGVPYSPATGLPIESQTTSQMVDRVKMMGDGARLYIMAPIVRGRKGEYKKELRELQAKGFQRAKINGTIYELTEAPTLDKKFKHDIDIVVDRLVLRDDLGNRLADSIETALRLADGLLVVENADNGERQLFSEKFACPVSGFTIPEIEPRLFSFNSPHGACPHCDGLGQEMYMDPDLVVPDQDKSIAEGAVEPWSKSFSKYYMQTLEAVAKAYKASIHKPWSELDEKVQTAIIYGTGDKEITFQYDEGSRSYKTTKPFEGVIPNMERRIKESDSQSQIDELSKYQQSAPCEECGGARLKPEALAVKINKKHISDSTEMSIADAQKWFGELSSSMTRQQAEIAARILKEINERLTFLVNVGLDYLTLSRASATLSGGESQRIRLASQIGSGLTGVMYVLDEPSIGLHQRDNNRLLDTLKHLRDIGNTVLVVEHDEDAIRMADYLIDMGPGAGIHGGQVIASGTPEQVFKNKQSVTAQYMTGKKFIPIPAERRKGKTQGKKPQTIKVINAHGNNLKNINVDIPLGTFTCITGVSGSGKSTFTIDTLYKAASKKLMKSSEHPAPHDRIEGLEFLDKVIDIDQSPIGRTPRSNPATYTGCFTPIRDWYAGLPESKARGYGPGRFSFNVKGGRCEACQGDGLIKIEMHFLPDVYVTCETCEGRRYNRETLEVKYKERSISDVLDMSIEDAADFFKAVPSIRDKLETMKQVGLDYIKVGQAATTLSGGEAQRVKLSKELSKRATGQTLYILDEPTTGLHFEDVRKLLEVLQRLVDQGNTIVVIEHNLDVIKTADWIIDIGPEGGSGGGQVIATGTPEEIVKVKESYTGQYLKPLLKAEAGRKQAAE
ncbi:MAG: excinuclease ABC subunit A [Micavibrio aeruginosavorus]|uniref:UvrABC system protein A n=1 Tax=Micavibrio aeruginosavorus TaxID=349221 RepID=A0A2W5HN34_9BACT|nr:MAG: excinuclease ABC subunit A [Micavibrio aeruginosavorus]